MTTFNDREKAAENKYAHDHELSFRITARRNKLLGLWAAAKMNVTGAAADDYSKSLISAGLDNKGDDNLVAKVRADLSAKGVTISEHDIREELFRVNLIATDQIKGE